MTVRTLDGKTINYERKYKGKIYRDIKEFFGI